LEDSPSADLERRLHTLLENARIRAGLPGIGLVVLHKGAALQLAVGQVPESGFALGCAVKFLVAAQTCELARRGLIELSAPLERYLPELARTPQGEQIRVAHLLSHTSGQADFEGLERESQTPPDFARSLAGFLHSERLFVPGTVFSYQQFGYVLLGQILLRVTGCPFEQTHTVWDAAHSARTLSLYELAVVMRRAFTGASKVVELPHYWDLAHRQQVPLWYGLGPCGFPDGWVGFNSRGSGQVLLLRFNPTRDLVVALGINAPALVLRFELLSKVLAVVCGPLVVERKEKQERKVGDWVGTYRSHPSFAVNVAEGDDARLVLSLQRGTECEVLAPGRAPFAFFRDPSSGEPCMMLGLRALPRISTRTGL
jgi:hypothetical protein